MQQTPPKATTVDHLIAEGERRKLQSPSNLPVKDKIARFSGAPTRVFSNKSILKKPSLETKGVGASGSNEKQTTNQK